MGAVVAARRTVLVASALALVAAEVFALQDVSTLVQVEKTPAGAGMGFRRGDCNADAKIDIADAICALTYLFGKGRTTCLDALDSNDDGKIDIADPIRVLSYLFAKGTPPPAPFGVCGTDPTQDPLGCTSFALCTGTSYLVKLVNASQTNVLSPLLAVVESVNPPTVGVGNADGMYNGKPYFSFSQGLEGGMLAGGEETAERTWLFTGGTGVFTFQVRVLGELTSGWIPMQEDTGEAGAAPLRKVGALDFEGITFTIQTPGLSFKPRSQGKAAYIKFKAPNASHFGALGAPEIPAFSQHVVVPRDSQISVVVKEGKGIAYRDILAWPNQYSPDDNEQSKPPPFIRDEGVYGRDSLYPAQLFSVTEYEFRGARMALVQVALGRVNSVRRQLTLYPEIEVAITFNGGRKTKDSSDYFAIGDLSRETSNVLAVTALNYSILETAAAALEHDRTLLWFYDLLIVSDRAYETQAEQLADHKRSLGFSTRVRYTDVIGDTVDDIRDYIGNQYSMCRISYVILFGDAEDIPCHYETRHPTGQSPNKMGTDLYYATMGGAGDLVPDIAIGRLPVNSTGEAQTVVDKIIDYETSPPSSLSHDDFYERVALAAYFQDEDGDTYADRGFAQTIEELFVLFDDEGYAPERAYTTTSPDPRYWNDGTAIPAYLRMPGFPWDGDAADISAMLNNGSFLLAHRDHGNWDSWSHPFYSTAHIAALTNGELLPVVFSINCQTGWFDRETDEEGVGTSGECFAEQFLTKNGGGGVASFGASRNSPSWPNNDLLKGMIDCIWPDMIPGYPTGADAEATALAGARNLGWVLNYGKLRVLDQWPTELDGPPNLDGITQYQREFEIYNLMGDPTLCIRTEAPFTFEVAVPDLIPYLPEFEFPVPPELRGVTFALIQDGAVVAKGVPSDSRVKLTLPSGQTLQPVEDTYLVAWGEGYVPFKKKIVFKEDVTPVCALYCLEVPTDPEGKSFVGEFNVLSDGDLKLRSTYSSDGVDRGMTSLSGFAATRRNLFAGHNISGEVEMLEFVAGGGLRYVAKASTKGGRPAYLAVDEVSERIFTSTTDELVETFLIGSAGLKPLDVTPLKGRRARDLATFAYRGRTFLYVGSQDSPPAVLIFQVKGDALIPAGVVDLSNMGGSRAGVKLEVAPKSARLYVRDLDAGVFAFTIDRATGGLTLIKGSPFDVGGFGRTMIMTHDKRFLYAAYSSGQENRIASFTVNSVSGVLGRTGDVPAPDVTLDLVTDVAERMLYAAGRTNREIARYAINPTTGALKYQGTTPVETKTAAPAALWAR